MVSRKNAPVAPAVVRPAVTAEPGRRFSTRWMLLCGVATLAPFPQQARADVLVDGGETLDYNSGTTVIPGALLVGPGGLGSGTVNIDNGATVQLDTTNGSTASRIELGNGAGGNGTLNINGGTLAVNIADGTSPSTSIGRIWVGGGAANTTGGTGALNMSSGLISFQPVVPGTANYGALAIGRGTGVTGTFDQTGGTVQFLSGGAIDLGTQGGSGQYSLGNNAVFDAGHGGLTMYIGSRTGTGGETSTGTLNIGGNAQFTATSGVNSGGQLYVGDAGSTGSINQTGAGAR